MSTFTFQVDRLHLTTQGLNLHADVGCKGPTVAIAAGDKLLYRGTVELDHQVRYVFEQGDTKLYTLDRAAIAAALAECLDELVVIHP